MKQCVKYLRVHIDSKHTLAFKLTRQLNREQGVLMTTLTHGTFTLINLFLILLHMEYVR